MLNGLYSAASGMLAQQTRMDMLANDLANVDTTGYKQARIGFRDLIYNTEQGMRVGAGSAIVDAGRNQAAGAFQATGDPLSMAIAGPGYFQVRRSDGSVALTRSGDFTTDAKGEIVTGSGERLVPPIRITAPSAPGRPASARSRSSPSRTPVASRPSATTCSRPPPPAATRTPSPARRSSRAISSRRTSTSPRRWSR